MIVYDEQGRLLISALNQSELAVYNANFSPENEGRLNEIYAAAKKGEVSDLIASPGFSDPEPEPEWDGKKRVRKGWVKSPYHLAAIQKGKIGEISKIEEEIAELKDAEAQGIKIMIHVELSDVYGALEFYAQSQGLTMKDLKHFSDLNKKVKSGKALQQKSV